MEKFWIYSSCPFISNIRLINKLTSILNID